MLIIGGIVMEERSVISPDEGREVSVAMVRVRLGFRHCWILSQWLGFEVQRLGNLPLGDP